MGYILWIIINIFMTAFTVYFGVTDPMRGNGFYQVLSVTITSWLFCIILVWRNVVEPINMEKRHRNFEENELPKIREKQTEECKIQQKESGLPTQEALEEIAEKFGFSLHGEFNVDYLGYDYSKFEMETHKSLNELNEMGIYTFKDIFKEYYLFFDYQLLRFKMKIVRDRELNAHIRGDENNVSFVFEYRPEHEENNKIEWDDDYIIQIKKNIGYNDDGYTVYRDSGIIKRKNVDELTENEKLFIITAKDNANAAIRKGTVDTGFFTSNLYYHNKVFQISPNNPLLLK